MFTFTSPFKVPGHGSSELGVFGTDSLIDFVEREGGVVVGLTRSCSR